MSGSQVHFELFARRKMNAPWTLEAASEDRAGIVEQAEEMLAQNRVAAVKVTKESLDRQSGEFKTITILAKGAVEAAKKGKHDEDDDTPLCVTPADLYTIHARERIGRLLDGWLLRQRVTPFELLHRPDLVEQLDASGVEIQHAVQKIAIPESQARGIGVHEIIRTFQALIQRAVDRLMKDGRRSAFPIVGGSAFAAAATKLIDEPERTYLLSGGVAAHLAAATTWGEKISLILDLAEAAPAEGPPRGLAFQVLEQPLSEVLGSRGGLSDLLGPDLDLGGQLAALTRLAADREVKALSAFDANVGQQIPPLTGPTARLAGWLAKDAFESVRAAIGRRILRELAGPRRLRPDDPEAEIAILRALAMCLTAAAAGPMLTAEEVQNAFVERCKALVGGDFVERFLAGRDGALAEAQALVRLAENMVGTANKRSAARWISAAVGALRFEKDLRNGADSPSTKLAVLAELQKAVNQAGLNEADQASAAGKIGEIGGLIEADAKLTVTLARANAPVVQRITLLLQLAAGQTAPLGPAADRAKKEAMRLLGSPEIRGEVAADPEALVRIRNLMQTSGLAA
jgi:hypothetical protein